MRRRLSQLLVLCLLPVLPGCSLLRVDRAAQVASGLTSHLLCSGAFVSGLDPDRVYAETVKPRGAMYLVDWALHYEVDRERRQVSTSIAGLFRSKAAYHEGIGCQLESGERDYTAAAQLPQTAKRQAMPPASMLPTIAGPAQVAPASAELQRAFDLAFSEPDLPRLHATKAAVVVQDGRVIGERYAAGYGIDTPLLSWSVAKSVANALSGILVAQGKLSPQQTTGFSAWAGAGDARQAITLDQLLRQTPGLDFLQDNSGFDPSTLMKFIPRDTAAMVQAAPLSARPGTAWAYSDGNYQLVSRLIRDAAGGTSNDVLSLVKRELFEPLGMEHATMEFDNAGTPLASAFVYASARDWARFGMLYLNDGMAGAHRILPPGWVNYSTTPTLKTGYGAGFWTNRVAGNVPQWGVPWGFEHAPRDAYFARGAMGQYVVVVPSEQLVIVRFGNSQLRGDDIAFVDQFVGAVLQALPPKPALTSIAGAAMGSARSARSDAD